MHDYNTIIFDFIQYKRYLGYKYKTDEIVLNQIKKYLLENNVENITREVIENFARLNQNLDSNTISRNMNVFRELCKYIHIQKGIECYQISKKHYPQNHNKYKAYIFSHIEIKKIYNNINNFPFNIQYSYYKQLAYPLIIKILYQTGIRIGELLQVTVSNHDRNNCFLTLKDTKNNQERKVAINDKLNNEIIILCKKFNLSKDDLIFNVSYSSIKSFFEKVLRLSDIKIDDDGPRLHDLRHTFVCHNIEKAIKEKIEIDKFLKILQTQLGHQSLNSLSYYFKITNDILNIVNNLSEQELGYLIRRFDDHE